jgi:hypothetical protein
MGGDFRILSGTIKGSGRQSRRSAARATGAANEGEDFKKIKHPNAPRVPLDVQYLRRAAPDHEAPPVLFPAHHALPAQIFTVPSFKEGAGGASFIVSHHRSQSHHGADVALHLPSPTERRAHTDAPRFRTQIGPRRWHAVRSVHARRRGSLFGGFNEIYSGMFYYDGMILDGMIQIDSLVRCIK